MGTLNEQMTAGGTYAFRVEVYNPRTELPEDLSGWEELWCTAKAVLTDADDDALFQLTMTGGDITLPDPAGGILEVTIPDDAFPADFPTTRLYLDVKGRDSDSVHWALDEGWLTVRAATTRAT